VLAARLHEPLRFLQVVAGGRLAAGL